jgi:hypothetical protein
MNSGIESSFYTGGIPVKHPALGAREDYWLQSRLSTRFGHNVAVAFNFLNSGGASVCVKAAR